MNILCCSTKILSIFPETHVVSNDLTLDTNLLDYRNDVCMVVFSSRRLVMYFTRYYCEILRIHVEADQDQLPHRANTSDYPVLIEIEHRGKQEKQKRIYHSEYYANANQPSFHKNSTNKSFEEFSF